MADKKKDSAKKDEPLSSGEVVTNAANESVNQWRAMQGLPPIDHSKEARHPKEE